MIKILLCLYINLFIFSSIKSQNEIDIALGTKNRMNTFKLVIQNLNNAQNATNLCLYIMDGNNHNEVKSFLNTKKWNFKSIRICKDSNVQKLKDNPGRWSVIYDYLIRLGKSPYVTYWSDDILISTPDVFAKAINRLQRHKDAGVAIFNFKRSPNGKFGIVINQVGLITINFGIIKREAYSKVDGLDHIYKFFRADSDLTNKIYFKGKYKTIINNDCYIQNLNSDWKNPFSQKIHYQDDMDFFDKKWSKYILRNMTLNRHSIAQIFPENNKNIILN